MGLRDELPVVAARPCAVGRSVAHLDAAVRKELDELFADREVSSPRLLALWEKQGWSLTGVSVSTVNTHRRKDCACHRTS